MRRRFILPLLAWLYAGGVLAAAPPGVDAARPLRIEAAAVPLDASDGRGSRVGALRYLGGLRLTSPEPRFGGLSGLRIAPDGRALMVSDTGNWVAFRLVERGGRLVGVRDAWIAPLRDASGEPPLNKGIADAEALEWDPATGAATVAFEQQHRLQHYAGIDPARPATLDAPALRVERLAAARDWPDNGGAEAMALVDGAPLLIAESGPEGERQTLRPRGALTVVGGYRNPPGFSPTDMAADGHALLVVNRRFAATEGPGAIIVRWRPGAPPESLARFAAPLAVDNMEGLAVVRAGRRRFIYLLSDDNFNPLQRTLLLKFELIG